MMRIGYLDDEYDILKSAIRSLKKYDIEMLDEMTLTLSGDTMTITANDDTIITIDGEDATLDELQVGDTVSFFLDGETVTSLSVGMPEPTQPMQAPEQN